MLTQDIIEAIQQDIPSLKESTINKKYNKYVDLCYEQFALYMVQRKHMATHTPGLIQIDLVHLSNKLGYIRTPTTTIRVKSVFDKHCPLFTVVRTGSKIRKELSHVRFTDAAYALFEQGKYNIMNIKSAGIENYKQYIKESVARYKDSGVTWLYTPINLSSLEGFIEYQHAVLDSGKWKVGNKQVALTEVNKTKLRDEIHYARLIKDIALAHDGHLPQIAEESIAGRVYYKGVNLQNCPKNVRTAALGDCVQYDMNACSYAVMLNEMRTIYDGSTQDEIEQAFRQVYHYIKDRKVIRNMLVTDMNHAIATENKIGDHDYEIYDTTIKQVKAAFTSIGFGCKASNLCWTSGSDSSLVFNKTALRDVFKSKVATQLFLDHWFVKEFIAQVEAMRTELYTYYKDINFEVITGFPFKHKDPRNGKAPSKSQAIAHIYQGLESKIITSIADTLGNDKVLLLVHDGFIVPRTINATVKHTLLSALNNPYLTMTCDVYNAFTSKKKTSADYDIDAHRAFIAQQEADAKRYEPASIDELVKTETTEAEAFQSFFSDLRNNDVQEDRNKGKFTKRRATADDVADETGIEPPKPKEKVQHTAKEMLAKYKGDS